MARLGRISTAAIAVLALSGCAWLTRSSVSGAPQLAQADAESRHPALSGSGRFVAFDSTASNLVGDDTNAKTDVFVHDNVSGATERVSVASNGAQADGWSAGPSISNDGRYVAFTSDAANLATDGDAVSDVFVHDRTTGTTELVSINDDESPIPTPASQAVISGDGRSVAFTTTVRRQIIDLPPWIPPLPYGPFVRNLDNGSTRLMPLQSLQRLLVPNQYDLSDDGRRIVYTLVNVDGFVSNVVVAETTDGTVFGTTGTTTIIPDNSNATPVGISGDGTKFVFVVNPSSGANPTLTVAPVRTPTEPTLIKQVPPTSAVFLAADGSLIGAQIHYGDNDIAVVTPPSLRSLWTVVSASADGKRPVRSTAAAFSSDLAWVAFTSNDGTLVSDDTNAVDDVFTRSVANSLTPPT